MAGASEPNFAAFSLELCTFVRDRPAEQEILGIPPLGTLSGVGLRGKGLRNQTCSTFLKLCTFENCPVAEIEKYHEISANLVLDRK